MNGESALSTFLVAQIQEALGAPVRFDLADQVFGISDANRITYMRYRLAIRESCATQFVASPPHLVQLADMARTVAAVKSELETLDKMLRILETWESKPLWLNSAVMRRHARLMFELAWDAPFGGEKTAPPSDMEIVRRLDELLLLSVLSRNNHLLWNRSQLNAELIRPSGGRLSRIHSNTVQRNEVVAQSAIAYYGTTEAQVGSHFLKAVVAILRGELDFLDAFAVPAKTPEPLARSAAAQSGQFATKFTLSDLLEEFDTVWVGGSLAYVDTERLEVLERMENEFGADNCYYARGVFDGPDGIDSSGSNIDESYVILVARRPMDSEYVEDAIAISSIAGRNATYYVRGDVSQEHWTKVLTSKIRAQSSGARRLKFVSNFDLDEYDAMHEKLSVLSTCRPSDFASKKSLRYSEMYGYEIV